MPAIYADRYREIDALLDAVLDLPPVGRRAFIENACAADQPLRDELLHLVELMGSSNRLEKPSAELAAALFRDLGAGSAEATHPDRVGPFHLVREIGRGGMGAVFLGERDDGQFQQRVAVKLIGRATNDVIVARFLEERRILAMLDHPGIARLVDGGVTEDGTPWFAMEYVEGAPIDRYCDAHRLTIEQRSELFASVCDAVQYAHQHFVVHRDLKPSNILVTDDGHLKLLDFGIAKLLDPLLSNAGSDATLAGWRALTPEYAAPEQIRGLAVSTATDVYALGVLLYLLLAGRRPYDLRDRPAIEVERLICEIDPPRPSAVVDARHRRALRGDFDVIVMQALRKDPARRYASASALRDDLDRRQRGLPIRARGDAAAYRLTKFAKRRAWPLVAAASAVALLTGATVRERALRSQAEEESRKAEQTTDFMFGLFEASENGQSLSDTTTAKQLVERGIEQARAAGVMPEERAQMLSVLGRLEMQIGSYAAARPLLTEALALRRTLYEHDHPDIANSLGELADVMFSTGDTSSIALRREQLAIRRRISGNKDVKTTDALFALAQDLHAARRAREGDSLFKEWQSTITSQPPALTPTRLKQLNLLAEASHLAGQPQRAESLGRAELSLAKQIYGDRNHQVAAALLNLALVLDDERRFTEAEAMAREAAEIMRAAYPAGNPKTATVLKIWAIELQRLSRNQEAEGPLRDALAMARRSLGDQGMEVVGIEEELSYVLTMNGHSDEALSVGQAAVDALTKKFGPTSAMVLRARVCVADALRAKGRFAEAEPMLLEAEARFQNSKGLLGAYWRSTAAALARLYDAEGKSDEAAKYRQIGRVP